MAWMWATAAFVMHGATAMGASRKWIPTCSALILRTRQRLRKDSTVARRTRLALSGVDTRSSNSGTQALANSLSILKNCG